MSATTEQAWQAGIIVQTPFSVALAVIAQPFAVAVFDSHRPVIALSSRFVGKEVASSFLAYLFEERLGVKFIDAALSMLKLK